MKKQDKTEIPIWRYKMLVRKNLHANTVRFWAMIGGILVATIACTFMAIGILAALNAFGIFK